MPIIKLGQIRKPTLTPTGKKIGLGLLGAGALGLGAYGVSKLLKGRRGVGVRGRRVSSVAKLRNAVMRIKLKRLKIVEQRKLFKEQLRL